MTDLLLLLHHLDQPVIYLLRITIEDPNPAKPADSAQFLKKPVQRLLAIEILPIQCRLLGYQNQFLHALIRKFTRFLQKPLHRHAPVIPPKLRDDTVSTVLITPLRDLKISVVPACGHKPSLLHRRQCVKLCEPYAPLSGKRFFY